jgi:predicted RNase H-like nuclease (RuvC/YqgF family)
MKKIKSLRKRIRRLEARVQKGSKRLTKLKQKLGAAETRAAAKPKGKSAGVTQQTGKASGSIDKNKKRSPLKTGVKSAASVKGSGAAKSAKRKLNLTPERREQLAAAMRARWAAKSASAGANTKKI